MDPLGIGCPSHAGGNREQLYRHQRSSILYAMNRLSSAFLFDHLSPSSTGCQLLGQRREEEFLTLPSIACAKFIYLEGVSYTHMVNPTALTPNPLPSSWLRTAGLKQSFRFEVLCLDALQAVLSRPPVLPIRHQGLGPAPGSFA